MKTKTLFLVMIVIIITLSACEKTEIISDGPSQSVLDKGTSVGDSVTCRDSVLKFIACMDIFRQLSGIPAYYDERLLALSGSSNAIWDQYYVGKNGVQFHPVIDGLSQQTIISVNDWFEGTLNGVMNTLPDADSTYSGTYSAFTGRYGKWERTNPYDVYAVRITPGTGCQVGRFKLEVIVLMFVSQYYWVQNN